MRRHASESSCVIGPMASAMAAGSAGPARDGSPLAARGDGALEMRRACARDRAWSAARGVAARSRCSGRGSFSASPTVACGVAQVDRGAARCRGASSTGAIASARASRFCRVLSKASAHSRLRCAVAEDVREEHVRILAIGLEQQDVGVRILARYFSMPTFMREWMIARKVCASTSGSPPWFSLSTVSRPRARRALASNGTSGLTHNSSVHALVERDRRVQRLVERAVDVVLAVDLHRRKQARAARSTPRSRAKSARGRGPARRRSPTRRCRDWSRRGTACARACRKSLVRPGAANSRARKASIAPLSKTPVGIACASVANDSMHAAMERVAQVLQRRAQRERRAARPGSGRIRANAGRRKISGFSAASAPSSMNSRYICAGEMPFASAAATKPPDDTPT